MPRLFLNHQDRPAPRHDAGTPFLFVVWGVALSGLAVTSTLAQGGQMRFTEVTPACGVDFRMTCGNAPSQHILDVNGGGVALFDYDNDGDLDLFVANGAPVENTEAGPGSRLYRNRGDGSFKDVTNLAGLNLKRFAMGVAVGDFDADGCEDLFVTCFGPNVLLKNDCRAKPHPKFVDVAASAGVADARWATSAACGDTDADGDLDLYVVNYLDFDPRQPPDRSSTFFKGAPVMAGPAGLPAQADIFYINAGGRFEDATTQSGCSAVRPGYGLGVRMLDFDDDGRLDILVGNDSNANFLFHNRGQGRFEDIGLLSGIASNLDGSNQATMGIAIGDVDGNGLADVFTTNFSSDTNTLHLSVEPGFFEDRTSQFGLGMVSRPFLSWGTGFYDFDVDGDEDLFIASGHVYPEARTHAIDSEYEQPLQLFERKGTRFQMIKDAGAPFSRKYAARAVAFGDLDQDGDVDIVVSTLNGPLHILRNDTLATGRLVVELQGPAGNPRGLGSAVRLLRSGKPLGKRWIGGGSYQSVDAPAAYFGVPAGTGPLALEVRWPDGRRTKHSDIRPGQRVIVDAERTAVTSHALRKPSG